MWEQYAEGVADHELSRKRMNCESTKHYDQLLVFSMIGYVKKYCRLAIKKNAKFSLEMVDKSICRRLFAPNHIYKIYV